MIALKNYPDLYPERAKNYELILGDCITEMSRMQTHSIDAVICSPPYPGIKRSYGTWKPEDWLSWMNEVMAQCFRVLKPTGSAVVVIEPNYERAGQRRTWPWEFALNMAHKYGIVQDAYWVKTSRFPNGAATVLGLMRTCVEWMLWIGPHDCYRNQKAVLWSYAETQLKLIAKRAHMSSETVVYPHGGTANRHRMCKDNGGATPMNFFPTPPVGYLKHPACFPEKLAEMWVQYISPPDGVVLDPFSGSGTTGVAALRHGRKYIGIDKESSYIEASRLRLNKACQ
jgi:DNA modification methylase